MTLASVLVSAFVASSNQAYYNEKLFGVNFASWLTLFSMSFSGFVLVFVFCFLVFFLTLSGKKEAG